MRKHPLQNIEEIIVKKSEKKVKKYPRFLVQTGFVEYDNYVFIHNIL